MVNVDFGGVCVLMDLGFRSKNGILVVHPE